MSRTPIALLFLLLAGPAIAGPRPEPVPRDVPVVDATTAETGPGWIGFRLNFDILRMAGVRTRFDRTRMEGAHAVAALDPDARLTVEVPRLTGQVFRRGELRARGGLVLIGPAGRIDLRSAALVPAPGDPDRLDVVGSDGTIWMYLDPMMFGFEADWTRLLVPSADLRLTVAGAHRLGVADLADQVVGEVRMIATVARVAQSPLDTKAIGGRDCVAGPIWPGTPGYVADVSLVDMPNLLFPRCRMPAGGPPGDCDGPGGTNGEVVFASAAHLQNRTDPATSADIPWHFKFQGAFPPYGNDQHPFLVGALYRIDAQGRLEQVGRSGTKHAFFTTNVGTCSTSCPPGYILGPGCQDVYTISNNDDPNALAPRTEIIPRTGQWGRCGSIYDDVINTNGTTGCDGVQDGESNGDYGNRMIVREAQIDPALNPGARYFAEAWYVIRDDENIFNSMGSRELSPRWAGFWTFDIPAGAVFAQGPVVDRWVDPLNPGTNAASVLHDLPDGHVRVASRATALGGGRWRYDYVVMNFDFTRATTQGAEPNLRVVTNEGLDGFEVVADGVAGIGNYHFADGNATAGDDWTAAIVGGRIRWTGPAGSTQDWGELYAFGFEADAAPASGSAAIRAQQGLVESGLAIVPASAPVSILFKDSFEDP
jgi:hypothetical protein